MFKGLQFVKLVPPPPLLMATDSNLPTSSTPQRFAAVLFDFYKSLPQPKDLVLILLSFGDAKALPREAAQHDLVEPDDPVRHDQPSPKGGITHAMLFQAFPFRLIHGELTRSTLI